MITTLSGPNESTRSFGAACELSGGRPAVSSAAKKGLRLFEVDPRSKCVVPFISPSSFSALTAPCPRPSCSVGLGAGARPQAHLRQRRRPAHRERRRAQQRPAAQRVRSIMPTTTSITTTSIPMTLRLLQRRLPRLRRPRQCRKTCVGESGAGNLRRRRRRRLRPRPRRLLHHPLSHLPPLRLAPCPFSSRGLQSVACASLTLRTPMGRRRASSRPAYPARLGDSGATRVCNRARGPSSGPTNDVEASSSARMGNLCDVGALGPGPA